MHKLTIPTPVPPPPPSPPTLPPIKPILTNTKSIAQRRTLRSLSLSLPSSPLCLVDPTDSAVKVSPSLFPPTLIQDNLFLGSQFSLGFLSHHSQVAVLNVAEEIKPLSAQLATKFNISHYLHIPMSHAPDLSQHLPAAIEFIDIHLSSNRPVLVHCMCGVSRSAAVVLAYLMWKSKVGFRSAYEHVRSRRDISPNMHLVCQLVEFSVELGLVPTPELPTTNPSSQSLPSVETDSELNKNKMDLSNTTSTSNLSNLQQDSLAVAVESTPPTSVVGDSTSKLEPPSVIDHTDQIVFTATTTPHQNASDWFFTTPLTSPTFVSLKSPSARLATIRQVPTTPNVTSTLNCSSSPNKNTCIGIVDIRRQSSISSLATLACAITPINSSISPQSAMLEAFPLTDPDLAVSARGGNPHLHAVQAHRSNHSTFPISPTRKKNSNHHISATTKPNSLHTTMGSPPTNPPTDKISHSRMRLYSNPDTLLKDYQDSVNHHVSLLPKLPENRLVNSSSKDTIVLERKKMKNPPPRIVTAKYLPESN